MVQEHVRHHENQQNETDEGDGNDEDYGFFWDDEPKKSPLQQQQLDGEQTQGGFLPGLGGQPKSSSMPAMHFLEEPMIEMELHMVGGYTDKDGTSQEISDSLLTTFSEVADKYRSNLRMSLSTAAISCMNSEQQNDTNKVVPKSRGLGIDIHTGEVFPVKTALPEDLEGPAVDIRAARAWARDTMVEQEGMGITLAERPKERLYVIHDSTSKRGEIRIEPFQYKPQHTLNALLDIPDHVLLQYTSTSPECESDRFCSGIRRTVSFLNTVPPEQVFGENCSKTLIYARAADSGLKQNEWQPVR
jgi:hypothetical protein